MDWMKVFRPAEISGATSSVWLWLILVFAIFIKSSSAEQINITAVFGKNATLKCRILDGNKTINGLEWSKPELKTEYVLLYRDGHLDLFNQHPSFKNRTDLQDRQMKDGDVSLILNNVTTADAGIYVVRKIPETKRRKRAYLDGDPICIINLSVVDPPGRGPAGLCPVSTGAHKRSVGRSCRNWKLPFDHFTLSDMFPLTDQKNISATVGESVTLPCRAPDNSIRAMLWSRPDLEPKYILLYRDKQIDQEEQHPYFKDRVDLQDRQMKDGNVSLLLKDVTTTDSGTYECRVILMGATRSNTYPINIISLSVVDPPGPPIGLKTGLLMATAVLVVAIAGGIFIYRRCKKQKHQDPNKKPEDSGFLLP